MMLLNLLIGVLLVSDSLAVKFTKVYVEYGSNLGTTVPKRLNYLLGKCGASVNELKSDSLVEQGDLILSLGNASLSNQYLSLESVKAEGFSVLSKSYIAGSTLLVANGKPIDNKNYRFALDVQSVHYGAILSAYVILEHLGFAFLHPMAPIIPSFLTIKQNDISVTESPYWEKRAWHIHTQHPLEFTDVLNGFDVPMFARSDNDSISLNEENATSHRCLPNEHCESWVNMFDTLDGLFEWLVANRQNRVEVLLLGSPKWDLLMQNLTSGTMRQQRLKQISALSHEYGILIGADIPIANRQQHGWKMINLQDNFEQQSKDINNRVDWAFAADYDFISTESGLSEFTKPSCDLMLNLFRVFTERVFDHWHREAVVKVHCSTSQYCEEVDSNTGAYKYPDPRTGLPINFNFLPTYAPPGLGVMPHTVQVYSFSDPSADSYGNENFTYMADYISYEAQLQQRSVLYYGETAYWVNVDVDVPLFLPLSGQRRLADLRNIAKQEIAGAFKMQGQVNFESGWEFGYYLSNVITARAAWQPYIDVTTASSMKDGIEVEGEDWQAYRYALTAVLGGGAFGSFAEPLRELLIKLAKTQADLMVFSRVQGQKSVDLNKLSGHAYMSGTDTWVDLERMMGIAITQPDKVHLREVDDPLWPQVLPLLAELKKAFTLLAKDFDALASQAAAAVNTEAGLNDQAMAYVQEMSDCVQLLAARANHNYILYSAMDSATSSIYRSVLLLQGRNLLREAAVVMERRVNAFRVPVDRISGWRQGPTVTVYPFGYVWAAKSLYYLWRDQGVAEGNSMLAAHSPCYLNRQEPMELIVGYGKIVEEIIRIILKKRGMDNIGNATMELMLADCFAPPLREIRLPRDL